MHDMERERYSRAGAVASLIAAVGPPRVPADAVFFVPAHTTQASGKPRRARGHTQAGGHSGGRAGARRGGAHLGGAGLPHRRVVCLVLFWKPEQKRLDSPPCAAADRLMGVASLRQKKNTI